MQRFQHIAFIGLSVLFSVALSAQGYEVEESDLGKSKQAYAPSWFEDGVLMVSKSKQSHFKTVTDQNEEPLTRLFVAKSEEGELSKSLKPLAVPVGQALHQGPGCIFDDRLYFTSNLPIKNEGVKALGIFIADADGKGNQTSPFAHNSIDGTYDVAHPAISPDGRLLVFASNMPGGRGGSDLYYCEQVGSSWSQPKNCGRLINTSGNEYFPSFTAGGMLCFSTDGKEDQSNLDIYQAWFEGEHWGSVSKFPEPINSDGNDYSLAMSPDGESGFFSSDRGGKDRIYQLNFTFPLFAGCQENEKAFFCYFIEETKIKPDPNMPFRYEWDFGDGTTSEGFAHEHCFEDYGSYHITFNIYDTLAQTQFGKVTEMWLDIREVNQPYISSPDTLRAGQTSWFSSRESTLSGFDVKSFYWNNGEGQVMAGDSVQFTFDEPGEYTITLGALRQGGGVGDGKKCVTKKITVLDDEVIAQITEEKNLTREPVPPLMQKALFAETPDPALRELHYESLFYVQIKESEDQIPLDDPYFEEVNYEITERYQNRDSLYKYSVGAEEEMVETYKIFQELQAKGFEEAIVLDSEKQEFLDEVTSSGFYIREMVREEVNKKFAELSDIRFDLNSYALKDESRYHLDYIAALLTLEQHYVLRIGAHTDNQGNSQLNKTLSEQRAQSVVAYLVAKGIEKKRLMPSGYGDSKPITSNASESGRAKNRRVEFEVLDTKNMK